MNQKERQIILDFILGKIDEQSLREHLKNSEHKEDQSQESYAKIR